MKTLSRAPLMIAVPVLTLALLAPAAAEALDRTVSVSAEATLKVPNDTAAVGLLVTKERRSRGAALRSVSDDVRRVIAAVKKTPGVGHGDVTTRRISIRKTRRGKRTIYRAAEGVGVTLHQPDKAGGLLAAAIRAGATGISGPNYFVTDTERAFSKALAAAVDKAEAQARALAAEAGVALGPVIAIDEGEGPAFSPEAAPEEGSFANLPSAGCSGTGRSAGRGCAPPTKPGTSTVTAFVHVVFALQ